MLPDKPKDSSHLPKTIPPLNRSHILMAYEQKMRVHQTHFLLWTWHFEREYLEMLSTTQQRYIEMIHQGIAEEARLTKNINKIKSCILQSTMTNDRWGSLVDHYVLARHAVDDQIALREHIDFRPMQAITDFDVTDYFERLGEIVETALESDNFSCIEEFYVSEGVDKISDRVLTAFHRSVSDWCRILEDEHLELRVSANQRRLEQIELETAKKLMRKDKSRKN